MSDLAFLNDGLRAYTQFGKHNGRIAKPSREQLLLLWDRHSHEFKEMDGMYGHAPGHRTWIEWAVALLPHSPRAQVLPDCQAYGSPDDPPVGQDCWRTDGFESSLGYLLSRGLLKEGEIELLHAQLPIDEMHDILDWWRHPDVDNHPVLPLHGYELAVVMQVWDPTWKHNLLTTEELRRAAPFLKS